MSSDLLTLPGSRVSIEAATWRDLNHLRQLERACFPKDAWPLLDLIGVLTMPEVGKICLNVRASNGAAVKLYEEFGYTRAGLWTRYYEDGEDALLMEKIC